MDRFLTFTVAGVAVAAVYAIAACGLVVTYTTSGIFNFAHGAFGMMAAYMYWQVHASTEEGGWGWPTLPAFLFVVFVVAPIFGALIERVIMRGLEGASEVVKIVVTVSLMLALLGLSGWIWPENTSRTIIRFFDGSDVTVFGTTIPYHRLIILAIAAIVAVVLRVVLYNTRAGVAMRAVVDDRALVQLNGGRPYRSSMLAWAMGAALAALSGVLVVGESNLKALTLTLFVVNAYAAAIVGKLKSLPMTFVGALILGLGEAYTAAYISGGTHIGSWDLSNLKFAISPILLFVVMIMQPQARLRSGGVQRVRESWTVPTMRQAMVGGGVLIVIMFAVTDLMAADSDRNVLVAGMFFALVCLSLVPLTGFAGQISLAQMTFVGIGSVVMAVVGGKTGSPAGLIVALAVTAVVGALVALPALRLSGIYLALATAAFALFMTQMVFNQSVVFPGGSRTVPGLDLGVFRVTSNQAQVMTLTVVFALVGNFIVWLRRNSFGRRLTALKDSPVACATLGLDLTRTKIGVFALSASIAGLAGALSNKLVLSTNFELTQSMAVTTLAVVGGIGAVGGALFGGMLLGTFNTVIPAMFAANSVGVFNFFSVPVTKVNSMLPGFMGISLGRNPSGAIGDISGAYRDVGRSKESIGITVGGLAALWLLARSHTISNWTFVACVLVTVVAIVPMLPLLLSPIPGGRAMPAGVFLIAVLVATGAIDWSTAIGSNGMKILGMIFVTIFAAAGAAKIHGAVPRTGPPLAPSPDLIGVDRPLTRSDVVDADRALGLSQVDFDGAA